MRSLIKYLLAAAALALSLPLQSAESPALDAARALDRDLLSWVIAEQGNQALARIRAEARHAVRHMELPALPGAAPVLPLNSMVAIGAGSKD